MSRLFQKKLKVFKTVDFSELLLVFLSVHSRYGFKSQNRRISTVSTIRRCRWKSLIHLINLVIRKRI